VTSQPAPAARECLSALGYYRSVEMAETAAYIYCIVHSNGSPLTTKAPPGLPGATRPAVTAVANSYWLVSAGVPLASYGPAPLEVSLRNVQWVADVAVAHEAVVEFFARQADATVIPMKLFTMFSTTTRAVSQTRSRLRDIDDVVSRIAGCEEWGVRITYQPTASGAPARRAKSSSGTAFLEAKKAARDAAQRTIGTAAEQAEVAYTTLAAMAREARRRQDTPAGATSPPLLDAAFLVPTAARSRFKAAVKKLAAASSAGTQITLTGPWPSYNFIQPESAS